MRRFNVTGSCNPKSHYMVDITKRLEDIKKLIDHGDYFTINRARQYGKTTTIKALADYLRDDYIVLSLDFQRMGNDDFSSGVVFSRAFVRYLLRIVRNRRNPVSGLDEKQLMCMEAASQTEEQFTLSRLFDFLSDLCDTAQRPVVMMIDEVDSAANNQVFLDFLAQLRSCYLDREITAAFQSVILAGVSDVKNMKMKLRPDSAHKVNSPWNIATDFLIDMSFSTDDIRGMLLQYEADYHDDFISWVLPYEKYNRQNPYLVEITEGNVRKHREKVEKTEPVFERAEPERIWLNLLDLCRADASAQAEKVFQNGKLMDTKEHKLEKLALLNSYFH